MTDETLRVAVLGLGEAGTAFAADLVGAGADVSVFDPRTDVGADLPAAVRRAASIAAAVSGVDLVLSLTTAAVAESVAAEALRAMRPGTVFADLNTGTAESKRRIGLLAEQHAVRFAEVALMAPVPGHGAGVASVAAGPGADDYARAMRRHGARVEVIASPIGTPATRKLLRSVVMKGLAAAIVEALEAARIAGCEEWLRSDLGAQFGPELVSRLEQGSLRHAARRVAEMEAAGQLLQELGVRPLMADAARNVLLGLAEPAAAPRATVQRLAGDAR